MKINLALAVLAAVAFTVAASPADAAKKKVAKAKAAKVVVTKPAPYFAANANACFTGASSWWFPFAAIGVVGCGVVYAVPVAVEGFLVPQGGKA